MTHVSALHHHHHVSVEKKGRARNAAWMYRLDRLNRLGRLCDTRFHRAVRQGDPNRKVYGTGRCYRGAGGVRVEEPTEKKASYTRGTPDSHDGTRNHLSDRL